MAYRGVNPRGRLISGRPEPHDRCAAATMDVAVSHDEVQSACYVRELLMVEEGQSSAESDLPTAEPQPRHDFSVVQGFQVVGGGDQVGAGEQEWRDALRLEL